MNEREANFDSTISQTLEDIKSLLLKKGKEYRRENNPYHNFENGAKITTNTREEVLQGFLLKHLISVQDMRNDLKAGKMPDIYQVNEKYNDIIVYFLLEKAMMIENALEGI